LSRINQYGWYKPQAWLSSEWEKMPRNFESTLSTLYTTINSTLDALGPSDSSGSEYLEQIRVALCHLKGLIDGPIDSVPQSGVETPEGPSNDGPIKHASTEECTFCRATRECNGDLERIITICSDCGEILDEPDDDESDEPDDDESSEYAPHLSSGACFPVERKDVCKSCCVVMFDKQDPDPHLHADSEWVRMTYFRNE